MLQVEDGLKGVSGRFNTLCSSLHQFSQLIAFTSVSSRIHRHGTLEIFVYFNICACNTCDYNVQTPDEQFRIYGCFGNTIQNLFYKYLTKDYSLGL